MLLPRGCRPQHYHSSMDCAGRHVNGTNITSPTRCFWGIHIAQAKLTVHVFWDVEQAQSRRTGSGARVLAWPLVQSRCCLVLVNEIQDRYCRPNSLHARACFGHVRDLAALIDGSVYVPAVNDLVKLGSAAPDCKVQ